jgi:hypothetical protein
MRFESCRSTAGVLVSLNVMAGLENFCFMTDEIRTLTDLFNKIKRKNRM